MEKQRTTVGQRLERLNCSLMSSWLCITQRRCREARADIKLDLLNRGLRSVNLLQRLCLYNGVARVREQQ